MSPKYNKNKKSAPSQIYKAILKRYTKDAKTSLSLKSTSNASREGKGYVDLILLFFYNRVQFHLKYWFNIFFIYLQVNKVLIWRWFTKQSFYSGTYKNPHKS